jgi:hypothetical protein
MEGSDILQYLFTKRQQIAPNENPMEFRCVLTINKHESTFTMYSVDGRKRNLFEDNPELMQIVHAMFRYRNQMREREFGFDSKDGDRHLCLDIRQIGNKRDNTFQYLCEFYVWD